jgi:hypothetical protein
MILILTDPAVGGTFLTWSLHYLAGHKKYYHVESASWMDVPKNPLLSFNAHGFEANQPNYLNDVYKISNALELVDSSEFHTLYFHNLQDDSNRDNSCCQYTASGIDHVLSKIKKIILLTNTHPLYNVAFDKRTLQPKISDPTIKYKNFAEQHQDFIDYFFKESAIVWQKQKLTNCWDQREFLALNTRPFNTVSIEPNFNLVHEHYAIDTLELYNLFDQTIGQLFDFLNVKLDQSKLVSWNEVYNQWKKMHHSRLKFLWYFNKIINYIVNGYYMDLTRFNLDIVQEACIQHYLIYNHNLNFKTWQLEKFTNTKQLHDLLEPNIHPLGNY